MKDLTWRRILYLSLFGPLMGVVTVMGWIPHGVENFAWGAIGVFCAVNIARREKDLFFAHGAVIGFLSGASATFIQGLLSSTYAENNPWVLEGFADMPAGFDLKFFVLLLVPFIGIASALAGGLLAWLAAKAMKRDNVE